MRKKTLFKKCLMIRSVLYRVCNFKISGMMTSVFNVSPKSGHVMLFPKRCVFQLVIYFPLFFLVFISASSFTSLPQRGIFVNIVWSL